MEAGPRDPVPVDAGAAISDLRRHLPGEVDGQDTGDEVRPNLSVIKMILSPKVIN